MDPERWRRVEALFHDALAVPEAERATFLARACGSDAALRAATERLLAGDAVHEDITTALSFLPPRPRTAPAATEPQADPLIGRVVGAYRLAARIGTGGMGVVYRAVRADGLFDQEVAVKLVRAEAASRETLERFDRERRVLAALNHPHIARLYDGGTTSDGTPYLVMEFVRGRPIDRWCDERRLEVAERVRLFATLCRALHFAHQNLIVHGDVKPGNVLVDDAGLVKVVDFGIARLLDPGAGAGIADVTRTLTRILTPEYASPEQLRGAALTTAADVYSLGVLLYVLLTGRKPMRSDGLTPGEWERLVTVKEPTRPSTAVVALPARAAGARAPELAPEEFAARLRSSPARLQRALRGDLDRIVLMALRKDPSRRYESALQFAEDLERHLRGLPVQARDDTLAYRAWTFARRNRFGVAAAALVFLSLVVGLVVAVRAERRARAEAEHARVEADSFREIAAVSLEALLPAGAEPGAPRELVAPGEARAALLRRAEQVRRQYAHVGHLRANLLDALGRLLLELGAPDDAEALIRDALATREQEFGARSLEVALSLRSLAELHERRGELAAAAQALERALALHRSIRGVHTDVAMAANDLGVALRKLGRLDEAAALHEEALALRRAASGEPTLEVAECLSELAAVCDARGETARAEELLVEARAIRTQILGAEPPLTERTRRAPAR